MMYYLYRIGKFIALSLPRKLCYKLAKVIAIVKYYLSPRDRKRLYYNLSPLVRDKKMVSKYSQEVMINFSYYLVDFLRYEKLNYDFIKKYVKIEKLSYLKKALKEKKGVIILSAHIGNYELGAAVVSLLGYKISAIALSHRNRRVNDFFNSQREIVGIDIIPVGGAVKKCFQYFKQGKIIAFLGDRDFSQNGEKVLMFSSLKAILPRGIAFFSLKTQANILPVFLIRENIYYYRLIFEKIISPCGKKSDREIIESYTPILEKYIKLYPQQWYMFEKYWV